MAIETSQDLLALFTQAGAIQNSDQILLHSANDVGGNYAVKVTAEALRAYVTKKLNITIGEDGYIYIGGQKTNYMAEGITPELVRRPDGIYCTIDHGITYTCIAYYSDFGYRNVVTQVATNNVRISPNVLNVWETAISSLSVQFVTGISNAVNEYMLEFTVSGSNFTLTLPDSVRWSDEPEWADGYTYQVSIENNLAIYAEWEAASA